MYIIKTQTGKRKKNGDLYYNYRLVAGVREKGQVKHVTILSLGAVFDIPKEYWPVLCRRVESILLGRNTLFDHELDEFLESTAQTLALRISDSGLRPPFGKDRQKAKPMPKKKYECINVDTSYVSEGCSIGPEHVALHGVNNLKFEEIFRRLGFTDLQNIMAITLIIARMVHPCDETETCRWLKGVSGLVYLLETDFKKLESSFLDQVSDLLYDNKKYIENEIFNNGVA
jgi:hypothetical protein